MTDINSPELAYLDGRADDGFDLPRYAPRQHTQHQESAARSPVGHGSYQSMYAPPNQSGHMHIPPPPPPLQLSMNDGPQPIASPINMSPGLPPAARQHNRLSQILDADIGSIPSALSRSASLSGSMSLRTRNPHRVPDDLERAYVADPATPTSAQRQQGQANAFYPPSVSYASSSAPLGNNTYKEGSGANSLSLQSPQAPDYASYAVRQGDHRTLPRSSTLSPRKTTGFASSQAEGGSLHSTYHPTYGAQSPGSRNGFATGSNAPDAVAAGNPPPPHLTKPSSSPYPSPYTQPLTPQSQSLSHAIYNPAIAAAYPSQAPPPDHLPIDGQSNSSRTYLSHANSTRSANSISSPNTPVSQGGVRQTPQLQQGQQYYTPSTQAQAQPMIVETPRRRAGFKRVRDARDLRPHINPQPLGRRADPSGAGAFLSPLKCLTTHLSQTYNMCNPSFRYETASNPRRVLTKPSKPVHNDGFDNEDYDYILYVNDWLGTEDGQNKYLILDILGQGTFGQVVKCQNMKTHEICAVKVVKNKPAYFNQSMMEVTILEMLNKEWDPHDEHHILRMKDQFIHKSHLCLVFELLSSNLYELIKQNQFGGLSTQLVKVFTTQLLDALTVLNEARLIHCDLKPENILLKSLQSPQIKVIDFGSACHERQTVYTYIQSRFYRSPEVLLGMSYTSAIDMWSLGCIAVELFLGLPLFPGTSEYNQLTRIVEMLGLPPSYMLEIGKQTNQFFAHHVDEYGRKKYRLKPIEQYSREHGTQEQPGKKYFSASTLPEIIQSAPFPKTSKSGDAEKEMSSRAAFIDFVQGLLNLNPIERWSPQQAKLHPFITGEKFTKPYVPVGTGTTRGGPAQSSSSAPPGAVVDPKRPYGGLVPSQPKGTRAYTDAAAYNQHLAQHQAYTAQAANQQAANNAFRNPYASNAPNPAYGGEYGSQQPPQIKVPPQQQQQHISQDASHRLQHQTSVGSLGSMPNQYPAQSQSNSGNNPNPPSMSYYPSSRARANTINQMDVIPPQIARINMDVSGIGRNTLTPVLNRGEEPLREWERRQSGKNQPAGPAYPHLEYLQQQAELAAHHWNTGGGARYQGGGGGGGQPPIHFQSPPTAVLHDSQDHGRSGLREVAMAPSRAPASARYDPASSSASLSTPPQAYSAGSTSGNRYVGAAAGGYQQSPTVPFDTYDHRDGMGTLYVPLQPHQYQNYSSTSSSTHQPSIPANNAPSSFYGSAVTAAGGGAPSNGQRNLFPATAQSSQSQAGAKDTRRPNDMDIWPR
ncbi:hypothetical protein BOTBODRAFT_26131 [Botryobasidium botryosum FD-172 SS1]|uniref:Protein kinase domain-containing protein n=1 Tax=Botryobasidium botryosum (strain FD-172 SS1) TaxID=930990 RepID=A0A067N1G4_BOTB1|nr:hypothetical protein BOTBODRAFT_26131 [Botryobasidium botryosum FD-172 SS1]